jgi:hypothetical protein
MGTRKIKEYALLKPNISPQRLIKNASERIIKPSGNDAWSTPPRIMKWLRSAVGVDRVWFDPCGNKQNTTDAQVVLHAGTARPACDWPAPHDGALVYQNHPYSVNLHWALNALYYIHKYRATPFHYVVLANNSSGTEWFSLLTGMCDAFVSLHKRVAFIDPATGEKQQGNNYGTCIWYFGPKAARFAAALEPFGNAFEHPPSERYFYFGESPAPHQLELPKLERSNHPWAIGHE